MVDKIRKKGGRFLRRCSAKSQGVVWVDIGDVRAREKTCQALREGAPEIRRRKAASGNDAAKIYKGSDGSLSASSTFDRTESDEEIKSMGGVRTQILRTTFETEKKESISIAASVPMVIRPSMTLLCGGPSDMPLAIPIDHLDEREREMYLRDFLPPNPSIQKKKANLQPINKSASESESRRDEWGVNLIAV